MSDLKKRFNEISKEYDEQRKKLIPCFDDFYRMTVNAVHVENDRPRILDLGAGTGLLASFFHERYPNAHIVLIDFSREMLDVAKRRFSNHFSIEFIEGDYLTHEFKDRYDVVCSALSIHHLEDEDKRRLFGKCFSLLKEGGVFVNADQVRGETPRIETMNKKKWKEFIEGSGLNAEAVSAAYGRMKYDKEAGLDEQIQWLKEAGFDDVCCLYRYYQFTVLTGRKANL